MENGTLMRPRLLQSLFHLFYILSRDVLTINGFGFAVGFIAYLDTQPVTTSNYGAIANSYTLYFTKAHT
jgi:hypothetical protein